MNVKKNVNNKKNEKKNVAPNIEMIRETDLDIFITLFKASNSGGH